MQDLTSSFLSALAHKDTWNPERIAVEAAHLAALESGFFIWERGAGEDWMYLLGPQRERHALIWTQAPLAVIAPQASTALREFFRRERVSLIEADDWEAIAFSINPGVIRLHGLPSFWLATPDEVPEDAFTILDLVWATE